MNLYRVTFMNNDTDTLHSTTFTALSREEAVKSFHTWADGVEADLKFIACVEVL